MSIVGIISHKGSFFVTCKILSERPANKSQAQISFYLVLSLGSETFSFSSHEGMMEKLDDYVGESGLFTPLVKCVTLGLCSDDLREISVVDTPGLNDPVPSRTEKTRKFIETCDAAFFLSRSSYFLDENDMGLLTTQLPQKGIKRLILVASQYDSALMDAIFDHDSLNEADLHTRMQLMRHTAKSIDGAVLKLRQAGCPESVLGVMEQCRKPVFVSAMAHRMSLKSPQAYTPQEEIIFRLLSEKEPLEQQQLQKIGNFAEIQEQFSQLAAQKDAVLESKAVSFVAVAQADFRGLIKRVRADVEKKSKDIEAGHKKELTHKMSQISTQSQYVHKNAEQAFLQFLQPLEDVFSKMVLSLQQAADSLSGLTQQVDVEIRNNATVVSDALIFKPWTWGKKHREYSAQHVEVAFQEISEVLEEIRLLEEYSKQLHENGFSSLLDTARLQNKLAALGIEVLGADNKQVDADYLKKIIDKNLSYLRIPRFSPDTSEQRDKLKKRFPSRVTGPAELDALEKEFLLTIKQVTEGLLKQFEQSKLHFEDTARQAQNQFVSALLTDSSKQHEKLSKELSQLQMELGKRQEVLELLDRYL